MNKRILHTGVSVLAAIGIAFSLYIIGWVHADNNIAVGTFCFIFFVSVLTVSSVSLYRYKD